MKNAIKLNSIYKSFDKNDALVDTFFSANWGKVHALLGENGAGKSTLMNILCGLYIPDRGSVLINNQEVDISSPIHSQSLGIGMVHQHFKLIRNMTVAENLILVQGKGNWKESQKFIRFKINDINKMGLSIKPDAVVENLSVAEQQRVEIAKILIGGAEILILDEPTAVLTDEEANTLLEQMRVFAKQGKCVVIITHKLREVIQFADKVTVMRGGKTVAKDLQANKMTANDLSRLMVGEAKEYKRINNKILKVKALSLESVTVLRENDTKALDALSLNIYEGQIYGLAGVSGNGQTELAEFLMGIKNPSQGKLFIKNKKIERITPQSLRRHGLACVPAERYIYGLAGDLSIMENFAIAQIDDSDYGPSFWTNYNEIYNKTEKIIREFNILGATPLTKARILSGGNAQKLVLARELSSNAKILIAHSPTRGLDVRACIAVHENLRKAAKNGVAVLLLSEDLDEIMSVSDFIGVINRGKIVGEFNSPANRVELGKLMTDHA